jgi:hypothetical protein
MLTGWAHDIDEKQALLKFDTSVVPRLGAIGDRVWLDENGDGLQGMDEFGVPGVVVKLRDCDMNVLAHTETDAEGFYLFGNLEAGSYKVQVELPEGYSFTNPDMGGDDSIDSDMHQTFGITECIELATGQRDLSQDAGLIMADIPDECGPCEGKVTQLTLRYLGADGRYVKVFDDKRRNPYRVMFRGRLDFGEEITIEGTHRNGKMHAKIAVYVGGHRHVRIHTSCSEPIGPGMVFGDFEVVEGYSSEGGLLCPVDTPDVPGDEWCDAGKPKALTLRYTGEGCSFSNHSQSNDKVRCQGDPEYAQRVKILVTNRANPCDRQARIWYYGEVDLDGTFVIDAANGCRSRLSANTYVFIYGMDNRMLQSVKFHTSCSEPLEMGDQFGSLKLEGFTPRDR